MTISVANIATSDTFGTWLSRTNDLATIASQNAVTVDSTVGGSLSTGNGFVNGYFGANTLIARDGIAGGNLSSFGTLNLIANIAFIYSSSNLVSVTANSSSSNLTITTNAVNITSSGGNTSISGINLNINSTAINANSITTITGNTTLKANGAFNVFTVTGNNTATRIVANTSNTTIVGNVFLSNTLSVDGYATFGNNLNLVGSANIQSSANIGSNLGVVSNANVGGNLYIGGNTNIVGDLGVGGNTNIAGNLGVSTNANIAGNVSIGGNLNISGNIVSGGAGTGNLIPDSTSSYYLGNSTSTWLYGYFNYVVASNTITTANLVSTGTSTLNVINANTITISGNTTFSNSITVTGNATFSNAVTISGNATFSNTTVSFNGLTSSSNVAINSTIILNSIGHQLANSYTFTNSLVAANIDLVSASTYRSFEYLVQLSDSTVTPNPYYHSTKIAIIHDGTNPYVTEYGTLFNSVSLGTFNVIINGGNIALQLTPTTANVVAKFIRTSIVP
jgi:UDP-3-O-[3-hydroxymyristoyl] glucosamine N-acyltransferase